ncbi:hypothetical protein BCON_0347g00100 [Botryotinia convoluta]|uniref:Uncharacterized protein n=1 Tax=Botryotinia convoluta TaxID=54673 RepID=A0A4Z1HM45_9HELO|nr:hypothetical protein BCON_0347g00100 [Botryotinia convoluta]
MVPSNAYRECAFREPKFSLNGLSSRFPLDFDLDLSSIKLRRERDTFQDLKVMDLYGFAYEEHDTSFERGAYTYQDNVTAHQRTRTPQSVHRNYWNAINSICHSIRFIGKIAFFKAKIFATHDELPALLQRGEFKPMIPSDQALALSHMRSNVIANAEQSDLLSFDEFPKRLAAFECLHHYTMLYGCKSWLSNRRSSKPMIEWMITAWEKRPPIHNKIKQSMPPFELPRDFMFEGAWGPGSSWVLFPKIRDLLRIKEERKRLTES